ncbi:MAG: cytochrome c [Pseudomonadota bacterium]
MKLRHLVLSLTAAVSLPAVAADLEAGKKMAAEVCASCHGAEGKAIADNFPNLAGQYEDYLKHSLRGYRDGSRKNAVMAGFATNLSDEDIANLAAWYASQTGLGILPVK